MFVSDVHCPGPPLYVPLAPYLCLPCSCICPSIFTCRCLVPSLQGESAAVAEAVFEAALPRNAGDTLPSSPPGILVAIADRLDSLVRNNVFLPHPPHSPSPAYPVSPLHTHTSPPPTLTHPPAQVGLFAVCFGPSAAPSPPSHSSPLHPPTGTGWSVCCGLWALCCRRPLWSPTCGIWHAAG